MMTFTKLKRLPGGDLILTNDEDSHCIPVKMLLAGRVAVLHLQQHLENACLSQIEFIFISKALSGMNATGAGN